MFNNYYTWFLMLPIGKSSTEDYTSFSAGLMIPKFSINLINKLLGFVMKWPVLYTETSFIEWCKMTTHTPLLLIIERAMIIKNWVAIM